MYFRLDPSLQYLGDHEKTKHSLAIEVEFLNTMRNTGLIRDLAFLDTFTNHGAFSANMSEVLIARSAMMNHPVSQHLKSVLILSDDELREANE
jgi:hypothetical protein